MPPPSRDASLAPSAIPSTVSVDPLSTATCDPATPPRREPAPLQTQVARFRVLRFHAKGGLGQVHVALDEELLREVALKEIQSHQADSPAARDRFMREAEITGQLEHPGVVPVYGLGVHSDGRPYYAMRFIRGDSLMKHIQRFHAAQPVDFRSRAFRELLGRFVDVCQAVAYAHARQVLHRDLKPDNIMLGKYGETLVVDWGLAKTAAGEQPEAAEEERRITLHRSGSAETLEGSAVGTPEYMSPEQAAGQVGRIGPAADIYSLGATLYCLLAGQPAFNRRKDPDILKSVQAGRFPSPQAVLPSVPRPLQAICLKAMAQRPQDRYAQAADVAADIENWLADEPVTAYRETVRERASRWVRKHPTLVSTAASSLGLLVLAAGVIAAVVWGFNRELTDKNSQLTTANTRLASANQSIQQKNTALESAQARIQNEARRATNEAQRANRQLDVTRQLAHTLQLNKVDGLLMRDPGAAQLLLRDTVAFPPDLRDVSWRMCERRARVLIGTERPTQTPPSVIRFAPTGTGYALATYGGEVALFRQRDDLDPIRIRADNRAVWDAAYSPQGDLLAVAVGNVAIDRDPEPGAAFVYRVADGQLVHKLEGHTDRVRAVAFSPDGQSLVTAGDDKKVQFWSVPTWTPSQTLHGHKAGIAALAFLDAATLVSASGDYLRPATEPPAEVLQWKPVESAEPTPVVSGQPPFMVVRIDAPRRRAATTGQDKVIRLWDLPSGKLQCELRGHVELVSALAFSSDGQTLASGSQAGDGSDVALESGTGGIGEIRLWSLASLTQQRELHGHPLRVTAVEFGPNGGLVSAGFDASVMWWQTREPLPQAALAIGSGEIRAMAVSPAGDLLAASSAVDPKAPEQMGQIVLWDLVKGERRAAWEAHGAQIESLAFAPDGQLLASGAQDNQIVVWRVETGNETFRLAGHSDMVTGLAFAPSGDRLVSASADKTVRIWDMTTQGEIAVLRGHTKEVSSVSVSPDGTLIASGDYDGIVRLWNLEDSEPVAVLRGHAGKLWSSIMAVAFSPDGQWLASSGFDEQVILWDVASRRPVHKLRGHDGFVSTVAFSRDGRTLASGGMDNTLRLWDVANGLERTRVPPPGTGITRLAFLPRDSGLLVGGLGSISWVHIGESPVETRFPGHELPPVIGTRIFPGAAEMASIALDRTLRIRDLNTLQVVRSWIAHDSMPSALAIRPDGLQIASADVDGLVRLWNPATGDLVRQFMGRRQSLLGQALGGLFGGQPQGLITCLDYSPDGRMLAVASMEKDLRIWNAATGEVAQTLKGHKDMVTGAAFFPDGK
jgi:WD40 repeat protein/serine/threonine protein kinase